MTKRERLQALINHYTSGNKAKFAAKLGITAQGLSTWLARNTFDTDLIYSKCEEISPDWLLTGHGEMFKPVTEEEEAEEDVEKKPRIPIDAAAGVLSSLSEAVMEDDCEMRPVISNLPDYDFTIGVKGDSMQPEFQSGDEVACRFIDKSTFIQWGKPHVLDTNEGVVLKRIYNRKDSILCRSDNPAYEDFEIPKEDILRIALVVGSIRFY